jgi:tetratricopeptide (TPR) repeat protein
MVTAAQAMQQAAALYGSGRWAEAEQLCRTILNSQAEHFAALSLLGVIAAQTRRTQEAVDLLRRALAAKPDDANAASNYGNVLTELKRFDEALASYERLLKLKPDHAEGHHNRGVVLQKLDRLQEALQSYERALAIRPNYAQAHYNRGVALRALNRQAEALTSYDRALAIKPDFAAAHNNRAIALQDLGRMEEALQGYERALAVRPDDAELYSNKGAVLNELRRWEAALAACDQALALDARHPEAYCNRSFALHGLARFDEAVACCDAAIRLRADYAEAYVNRGNALHQLRQFPAAFASYERALCLRPDYAEARCARALTKLLIGDFADGWNEYEWRWASRRGAKFRERRTFAQPLWNGTQPLEDKRILLHAEQGLGDTLQFCRYARRVVERGASVTLEVQPALVRLLSGLEGVSQLYARGDALPEFDLHCPLLSLPLAFKTELDSIPGGAGYLRSDPRRLMQWQARLGEKTRPRIGLAWSGSVLHSNDHNRSIPLALLIRHLPAGFQYVVVQNDIRAPDRATLRSNPDVLDFSNELSDFVDTAALCACVDVVVSVDTSVAHLSAALGKPTWILLPFIPDWRWLLDRTDTPWYPTARLYRQECAQDWAAVLERVAADLRQDFAAATIS